MINLYNTLSKNTESIKKKDHLNLYTCGPTVYNYAHIGNLRAFISADLLYRSLKYEGYNPRWVMNITDVDDKTIRDTIKKYGADSGVKELNEFTGFYLEEFIKNLRETNVLVNEIKIIRVSEVILEIQEYIVQLVKKGYGYVTEDGIYFSIEKYQKDFGDYGQLVGEKFIQGKKVGARVAVDEYEKDNLSDFALWKAHDSETDGQIFWEDTINDPDVKIPKGRPGWHIECSVINKVGFGGELVDIHTGGVDLIFPHHTNEIAQSQALLGKDNFVKYWFHSEHLLVDGKKMSKSANNFYTLKDLEIKVPLAGLALRYLFTQRSYRAQQNFTLESFTGAYKALEKLFNILESHKLIGENQELQQKFVDQFVNEAKVYLESELNLAGFVSVIWSVLNKMEINIHTQDEIVLELNKVLGLKLESKPNILEDIEIPVNVKNIIDQRQLARDQKDFAKSDELRIQIEALGYELKDTPEGQKLKKKL